jgi:hypothetical protein
MYTITLTVSAVEDLQFLPKAVGRKEHNKLFIRGQEFQL